MPGSISRRVRIWKSSASRHRGGRRGNVSACADIEHGNRYPSWTPLTARSSTRTTSQAAGSVGASVRERWTDSVARARGHLAHHHAVALALGPVVGEALALVHRAGAVVEERGVLLPDPARVVRVALDQAAAGLCDQLDGSAQGDRRQAVTAKAALDQDAGDPVVGQSLRSGQVLLAVVDVRQLLG